MTNYLVLTLAFVWVSFGVVAVSGYWTKNYTRRNWERRLITLALLIGGIISVGIPDRYVAIRHHHHHSMSRT